MAVNHRKLQILLYMSLVLVSLIPITMGQSTTYYIDDVPLIDQGNHKWCGSASVTMVLQYWEVDVSLDEVGNSIDPEDDGCYTYEIVRYLETYDFVIYEFDSIDKLKDFIRSNHPVIVLQWMDESKQNGHYRVVVGYDELYIYIHDPNGFKDKFTYELFFELWTKYNNYSITITPKTQFISDPYTNRTIRGVI